MSKFELYELFVCIQNTDNSIRKWANLKMTFRHFFKENIDDQKLYEKHAQHG